MKKVLVVSAILGCSILQANASNLPVSVYGGVGLVGAITSSDFKRYTGTNEIRHKENHIGRIGGEVFLGVGGDIRDDWFWGAEVNYDMTRAKHKHEFFAPDGHRIAYADIRHGFDLGLSFKMGKKLEACDVYGILGVTNKKVEVKYYWDEYRIEGHNVRENSSPSKNVTGTLFGLGATKHVNERVCCGVEYRYKTYGKVKINDDVREYRDKSDKHEVAFRVSVGV